MTSHDTSLDPAPQWNGVPEVIAAGTPREIGFIHGSQIPNRIRLSIKNYGNFFLETAGTSWAESRSLAATYLPALEQNEPDLIEEIHGIADGVGESVDFLDILTLNLRSEISLTNYSDGCTSLATRNEARSEVFVAQNWDWVREAADGITFYDIRKAGKPRFRIMGEAGIVAKHGFNDAGVGICMNAIKCGTVAKDQLPVHFAMRRVLECRSFDEALAMLNKKGLASCCNMVIGDKSGKFASVECTPKGIAPIYPEQGTWTVFHTNHLWSPYVPTSIQDHPAENSFSRLERIKILTNGQEANVKKIREWLSDEEGAPVSICRSTPPNAVGVERMETLATLVTDLKELKMEVSFGKPSLSPPIRTLTMA